MRSYAIGTSQGIPFHHPTGRVDPLKGLPLFLRLETHTGDNRPVNMFQDVAMSIPAVNQGDPIGGWKTSSKTGVSFIQPVDGKRPTINYVNGTPTVHFDNGDDYMISFAMNQVDQPFLLAATTKPDVSLRAQLPGVDSVGPRSIYACSSVDGVNATLSLWATAGFANAVRTVNNWISFVGTFNGASSKMMFNSAEETLASSPGINSMGGQLLLNQYSDSGGLGAVSANDYTFIAITSLTSAKDLLYNYGMSLRPRPDISSIAFTLRLQTNNGGLAPANLYKDVAATSAALRDGELVAAWKDPNTGIIASQANISQRPKLQFVSGKPVLRFDGVDDVLNLSTTLSGIAPFTVFSVQSRVSTAVFMLSLSNLTTAQPFAIFQYADAASVFLGDNSGYSTFTIPTIGKHVFTGVCNVGPARTAFMDGVSQTVAGGPTPDPAANGFNCIGVRGGIFANGDLSAVYLTPNILSNVQRALVENYLYNI